MPIQPSLLTRDLSDGSWSLSLGRARDSAITLFHGTRACKFQPGPLQVTGTSIRLTPEICDDLLLPNYLKKYKVRALNSSCFVVGPLVGILVSEAKLKRLLSGRVDPVYRRYARVLRRNMGTAVFFSPKRINWHQDKVTGVVRIVADKQEHWREASLPIPSVIYDRCFGPNNRVLSRVLRKRCSGHVPAVTVINGLVKLGKQQIYELCSQIPEVKQHLPRWAIVKPDNVDRILKHFPIAYIKPDRLSKGKGVTKVSRTESGFLVEQRRDNENFRQLCASPAEVLTVLHKYISDRGFMVVQEAISLMKYKGRCFDFRLLLQKDKSGSWKGAAIAARISGEGSVITSPRSGGSVATYDEVMAQLPQATRLAIRISMLTLAENLAKTIDQVIGPFAELGFDLGVDNAGEVRIIEVNGIPLKVSVERLHDRRITRNVHENPIEYAICLAGFGGANYD